MAALEKPRDEGSSYIFELQFFLFFNSHSTLLGINLTCYTLTPV